MPFVVSNGVRLNTSRLGQGPPMVMIHGLLVGNLASWYFSYAPAMAKHYSVLLYDLRGHGRSERPPTGYDLDEMTRDLAGLVNTEPTALAAGAERATVVPAMPEASAFGSQATTESLSPPTDSPLTLVGHSYGALVALNFAIRFPQRVDRLVLVEAPLPPSEFTEFTEFVQLDPTQMVESMPVELQAMAASGGRRAQRFVSGLSELAVNTTLLKDLQAEPDIADEQLSKVSCPVLAVYGKQSACRAVADRLHATIPDCDTVLLDGGHFLPLETPDALLENIDRFLNG